ncbi:hypothetical protein PROFUN_02221 [Planoprotostelium fungivorum]|uniref:Uncharacterized protein n=1 Tax=Planoprotostelium fungivorum TaxID=1890364 RepID=A0A2P6NZH2_9EUKA|nr:hypothetical protein PROFUN_02221 [Planoprotostelium fungivorum]
MNQCIFTRELNDQLWATPKQFWDKSKIRTENILPWFSTSDYDQYEWNLPEEMGNKGLIPRNLRRKIRVNSPPPMDSGTPHHRPYLPVHMSRRITIPPPSTSTHIYLFCYFFSGLPTGLQSSKFQLASNGLVAPNRVKLISE